MARGSRAIGFCQRSGIKMLLKDMVEDGHIRGLMVHPDWWEPRHPQEYDLRRDDPLEGVLDNPMPDPTVWESEDAPDGGTYWESGMWETGMWEQGMWE
jgi:hypothetical protein